MLSLFLLLILSIGFYWKLTLSRQYSFLEFPDLANQVLPWYQFQARAWHNGVFPLWDPHQWFGQPLVAQMQPGAAFPLNWPLFWAPLREGGLNLELFHWHFVLMHWLAAVFMYLYCREIGRSRFASILAGSAFSFGGYLSNITWPQMMNGALWLPLVFLFHHRAARAETSRAATANAACGGAALGMALLAGHHQAPLFMALALAGLFLYEWLTLPDRAPRTRCFLVTAAFAALVGAFALLPALEYSPRAYRWLNLAEPLRGDQKVPYLAQEGLGVIPRSLLGLVAPVEPVTAQPFVGLIPLALALIGVAACWQERSVRLQAGLALGGLAYALGPYSVLAGALYAVTPLLDKARSPGHAILLFHFGLLAAAARGADALWESSEWRRRLVRALAGLGALIALGEALLVVSGRGLAPSGRPLLLACVVAFLAAALLRAPLSRGLAQAGILLLLLVELSAASARQILPRTNPERSTHLDRFAQHRGLFQFLRAQPAPFRVDAAESEIPYNFGDWEGMEQSTGYLASVTSDLFEFVSLNWIRAPLMLNQVYVVGREKSRPEQVEVFAEPGGLKVFRNPDALPRAWVAGTIRETDRGGAAALMGLPGSPGSPEFDPRRAVFVLPGAGPRPGGGAPAGCREQGATVEWLAREIHRVAARASSSCGGMLVFGDPAYPGWRARVDGKPAVLHSAYGALRGVEIPAGEHEVELRFRPVSVYLGAALSAAGLLGCARLAARAASRRG